MTPNEIFAELLTRFPALESCKAEIYAAYELLEQAFRTGHKLLICGNGGSCADAEHIVGELLKSFILPRPIEPGVKAALEAAGAEGAQLAEKLQGTLPAISLCGHSALSTAFLNDVDPSMIFAQQLYGLGNEGDVLMALSTSGNSKNCVLAAICAKAKGIKVISLTGMGGGKLAQLADTAICAPEKETFKVQEYHLPIYHALCAMLESAFWG